MPYSAQSRRLFHHTLSRIQPNPRKYRLFPQGRESYKELCHMNCERYSPVRRGSEGTCPTSPRLAKIQQRDDRRHSATSSSPSSPVRLFQPLDSPLIPHSQSPLPPDISQGLQGLHLYGPGPPSPFSLMNNQQLAMIQEHSVLSQLDPSTGFPYPEISVTDETGCLPIYLLEEQESSRRPSITLGIGRPPAHSQANNEPEIPISTV